MKFTTREAFEADVEACKFAEYEADEHGALVGTTLDAIARVKSFGKVPLLVTSVERSKIARSCAVLQPGVHTVLGLTSTELTSDEELAQEASSFDKVIMCDEFDTAFQ